MKHGKTLNKLLKFFKRNYYVLIFFVCIVSVGLLYLCRLFFQKPSYVYVKVKISQGYWWASTNRPPPWFLKNIKKGDVKKDLDGQIKIQILEITYYPYFDSNQFDVYLYLKLRINKIGDKYTFNQETVAAGTPIELNFPTSQIDGTIINFSPQPLVEKYETKIIYLTKKLAYPWEYDTIQIGDYYFNGQQKVFEILDKNVSAVNDMNFPLSQFEKLVVLDENRKYIVVKAKVKVKKIDKQLVFNEEQTLSPGKYIGIVTNSFNSGDIGSGKYVISRIE